MDDEINQINQQETIEKLEKQIQDQKEDWEVQRKVLQKDKEKALHAAKFASQKLLDTVNDFQKQMSQQKVAQTKLAMLLHGKEQQLESLTKKVSTLFTWIITVFCLENVIHCFRIVFFQCCWIHASCKKIDMGKIIRC